MKTVFTGEAWTFNVELESPADEATATWRLRDNTGAVMSGYASTPVANLDQANRLEIMVPAGANTKAAAVGLNESRFLQVYWTSFGSSFSTLIPYQIIDFIPLLVNANEVRTACGLSIAELPDCEIDLASGAAMVRNDVGSTVFDAALIAGDQTTGLINLLIAYRCVLNLGPSIQLRVAQVLTEGDTSMQRLRNLTVAGLMDELGNEYDRIRSLITGVVPVVPTLFTRSGPTGPGQNMFSVRGQIFGPGNYFFSGYFPWFSPLFTLI